MSAYAAENPQSTWYTGANSIDILSGGDFQVKVPPGPPESYVESVNLLIIK